MKQPSKLPRWAQWTIGGVLLLIALAAGIVSLVLNVSHGLNVGLAAGITFGLADIGKIAIPIVAGIIGWSMQMRSTAIVCVLVSLFCATNYYADRHGRHLIEAQHGEAVYADKAKRISELEKSVADLGALVTAEAADRGCGPNCRALQARADEATLKLQSARNARSQAKPVEASGLAVMISMSAGTKVEGTARGLGAVNAVLFLALLEALVWLSVPAMRALNTAAAKPVATPEAKPEVKTLKPAKAKKKTRAKRWSPVQTQKMLQEALQKPDGRKMRARNSNLKITRAANENIDA
jgi:hypothetical protein